MLKQHIVNTLKKIMNTLTGELQNFEFNKNKSNATIFTIFL